MFTVSENVTGEVQIWAVPRSSYAPKDAPPFSYQLHAGTIPYQDGSVKICTHTVTLEVPAGVNLLQAALDTLEDAKVKAREAYMEKVRSLDVQIQNLRQLTHQPRDVVGEVLPPDEDSFY